MKWICMDSKETSAHAARNDGKEALYKQDSRDCGGALCDSKNLRVGVTFGGNDCPQIFRNARMLTQYRIYEKEQR